jgi:hypothetical protein
MEKNFAALSIKDPKKFNFTFVEVSIKSKVTSNDFKVFIPREIIDYICDDENFSREADEFTLVDKLKLKQILWSKDDEGEPSSIDLRENPHITDKMILKDIFGFLGSVNSKNDFTQFTSDDYLSNTPQENFIENISQQEKRFTHYLDKNIPIIFSTFKMKDMEPFIKALKFIGIDLEQKYTSESLSNPILTKIRNFVMTKNKILLVITPSNNFWIKSEKITIGTKNYDKKINNYSMIFYNWNFIQKFYDRLGGHPRLTIGFLNSMVKKNLQPCIDAIPIMVKNFTRYILFDQDCHDNTNSSGKPNFVRNFEKMKSKCKHYEEGNFNETNILVLESESEKITEGSKNNSLPMNVFSEQYMTFTPEELREFDKKTEKILDYLEKMLNECEGDIREYIANHEF